MPQSFHRTDAFPARATAWRARLAPFILALAIFAAAAYSIRGIYLTISEVHLTYLREQQALSVVGRLQYEVQESRRHFLETLVDVLDEDERLAGIARVREADRAAGLLRVQAIVLKSDRAALDRFESAWNRYEETRDDMVALSLRGYLRAAVEVDQAKGSNDFADADRALRDAVQVLESSSNGKFALVWTALQGSFLQLTVLLAAVVGLAVAVLAAHAKKQRILNDLSAAVVTLRESEQRFRGVFEEAAVGIVITNPEGAIGYVNRAVSDIAGFASAELIGLNVNELFAAEAREHVAETLARVASGDLPFCRAERPIVRRSGAPGWVRASVSLLERNGQPAEVIALWEDITEQVRAQRELAFQASHDPLTGLPNRRQLETRLTDQIEAAQAAGTELAVMYIDLDGFKIVNDTLGHAAGDSLLRQVAERLGSCLLPGQVLARLGGDEFAVLRPGGPGTESPGALARRLLDSLKQRFHVHGNDIHIGASLGISQFPVDGQEAGLLLQNADAAMYHAKRHENHGFYFFDAPMRAYSMRRLRLEHQLHMALERNEFRLQYQPLYELATNSLIRFEALCRWRNPELGEVSPAEFIPVAEDIGLIVALGYWVLEEACRQARRWQQERNAPVRIAVNVSAIQFSDPKFVDRVREILHNEGLEAWLLELELTESTLLADRAAGVSRMRQLRDMGISISIDDFGTGFSSLSYLNSMPVDALKIDRSFTAELDSNLSALSMIRSVIAMGRSLGIRVVTEGVETAAQLEAVRLLGADEVQGFYLGAPEDAPAAFRRVCGNGSEDTYREEAPFGDSGMVLID